MGEKWAGMSTLGKVGVIAVAVLVGITLLGFAVGSDDEPTTSDTAQVETPEPTPTPDPEPTEEPEPDPTPEAEPTPTGIDPDEVLATFRSNLMDPRIKSMCDAAYTHWACFYDGIEGHDDSTIRVNLTTDGGWSDDELEDMAERAGTHWFNFVGMEHEDLDTIIVTVNGRDHNVYRRDIAMLN